MQKSLAKNSIYNMIYTMGNILFPFFTSIYVSRILLPVGVGKVASAQNIASYFVTAAALGLPSYGVREFAKIRDKKQKRNKLFTELFLLNIISTSVATIAYYILIVSNTNLRSEGLLYFICGISVAFNYLNIDWMYQGLEEYGYITIRSLAIKILSFIVLLILVKTKQDYVMYALISCLATGGNYIFNILHARKYVKFEFYGLDLLHHIRPVLLIAGITFLSTIYNKIDITMLNILASDESVGFYTYAQKTLNIVLTMSNAVKAAFLPRLSYYYDNNKESFYNLLDKGFQVLCTMAFPLCIGLALVAHQVVSLLYGNAFEPATLTIRLMCPLILIKGFGDLFCYQLVYSTKNEKIILPASAAASIINILTNAILIPIFLQNGAVIASVFSEFITNAVQFIYMKKKIKFQINYMVLIKSIITIAVMILGVYGIMEIGLSNTISLLIEILVGGFIYIIGNLILKNTLTIEIVQKIIKKE